MSSAGVPSRERDTVPAPALDGAPSWAAALILEVQELRGALTQTNEIMLGHTEEMNRLSWELKRVRLAQLTLEHRANEQRTRTDRLDAIVLPIAPPPEAANG